MPPINSMAVITSTTTPILSLNSNGRQQRHSIHRNAALHRHSKPLSLTLTSISRVAYARCKDRSFLTVIANSYRKDDTFFTGTANSSYKDGNLLIRIARGAVFLVAGAFFFAALNRRPALALDDALNSNSSAVQEEKIDVVDEEDDETEMYARIVERDPSDLEALKSVVYGKMKKGKVKEAMNYVEKLVAAEPEEVEWRLLQALSYELMGNLEKAKQLFREILKERPLLIRALHGLALAMLKNQEGFAAFEMLNKALGLARRENRITEERNIKILIAQMHIVKGDLEGASKRFQELTKENPRDFRPYLCQGIIYSLLEKNKEADEQFELYRSLVPDEFPQRKFIDDAILTAKLEYQEQMKELGSEVSHGK